MTQYFGNTAGWALLTLHAEIESTETPDVVKTGLHQYPDQFQVHTSEEGVATVKT